MRKRIDWNRIDPLIEKYLPSLTIAEFTRQHASETIPRTIGQRAKKLGVKPASNSLSASRRTIIGQMASRYNSTPEIDSYFRSNNGKVSILQMASQIGWSAYAVRKRLCELGLSIIRRKSNGNYIPPESNRIDWTEFDSIIERELPRCTIIEFQKLFMPFASAKAIGCRAKKLDIEPKQYTPSKEHKQSISKSKGILTPNDIKFLSNNRDTKSIVELAKCLNVDRSTVCRAIRGYNIKLGNAGIKRAREASRLASIGKIPWNKGVRNPYSVETLEKMAIARQKQSGKLSNIQRAFYRLLDDLQINYYPEWSDKCRFGPWTFDCRIAYNNNDFLVEVQGDYIHSLPKNKSKDTAKATYMRKYFPEKPIKYVWEHEFGAQNLIKHKLLSWIGIKEIKQICFEFSDVLVAKCDDDLSAFLAAFHYLGKSNGRIKITAKLNNEIIAAAVWGAPTRIETAQRLNVSHLDCLELKRFVIHDSYHKKNFASWFLGQNEKMLPPNTKVLVSFADTGVGHSGSIYKAANWKLDGRVQPSYFYVNDDGFVMLKKTLYNKARRMHMSESDFADAYGYAKTTSPHKLRFIKLL